MDFYALIPFILFFTAEILLLLGLYRYLLRGWIIEHWEDKIREDEGNWLIDILKPAIDEICEVVLTSAPPLVIDTLKHELLSNQGTLTRMSKADPNNEQEVGMEMAEMFLKELGLKNPSVIMTLRAGKGLLDMYNQKVKGQGAENSTTSLPVGKDLFQTT